MVDSVSIDGLQAELLDTNLLFIRWIVMGTFLYNIGDSVSISSNLSGRSHLADNRGKNNEQVVSLLGLST